MPIFELQNELKDSQPVTKNGGAPNNLFAMTVFPSYYSPPPPQVLAGVSVCLQEQAVPAAGQLPSIKNTSFIHEIRVIR